MTSWTGAAGVTDWFGQKWIDPNNHSAGTISNWSNTPGTPGDGANVDIGSAIVTDAFGTQFTYDPLFVDLSIAVGGSLTANAGLRLTGNIANAGTLTVGSINVQGANVQWSGGGTFFFTTRGSVDFSYSQNATVAITNSDTLTGSFSVGAPSVLLTFVNTGIVNSNVTYGGYDGSIGFTSLTTLDNDNLIEATGSGSRVNFSGTTVDNTGGGTLSAVGTSSMISFDGATVLGGSLTTNQSSSIQANHTTIFDGTTAAINLNGNLVLVSGALTLRGTVNVSVTSTIDLSNASSLVIQRNGVTFAAGSQVTVNQNDSRYFSIQGTDGTDTLQSSALIHGGLTIVGLTIANSATGIIDADGTASTVIGGGVGGARATTIINHGLIEDTTSAGLFINGNTIIDDTAGGTLLATGAGSHIDITNATIKGGTVNATTGGVVNIADAGGIVYGDNGVFFDGSASALTLATGTLVNFFNSTSLHLMGAIANNGSFAAGGAASKILVDVGNSATLSGNGSVVLGAASAGANAGTIAGGGTLTNASNTISGYGNIYNVTLINQGTVNADTAGKSLNIGNGSSTTILHNAGLMEATNGATVNVNGTGTTTFDNSSGGTLLAGPSSTISLNTGSTITNNGTLEANGGTLIVTDAVSGGANGHALITGGGTINFSGNFQQNVVFQGGLSAGSMSVSQAYTGTVSGFAGYDQIDLSYLAFNSSNTLLWQSNGFGGGTLTVNNGVGNSVATLQLVGTYSTSNFAVSNDGGGHTLVSEVQSSTQADLVANSLSLGSSSVAAGGSTSLSYHIQNSGTAAAGASSSKVYLSTDSTITSSDTLLATVSDATLAAGASLSDSTSIVVPSNLAAGTYYVGVIADANGQVTESNESNNTSAVQITVTASQASQADLVANSLSLGSSSVAAGGSTSLSYHIQNSGTAAAGASNSKVYLSTDSTITSSDTLLATVSDASLAAGASLSDSTSITLPSNLAAGTYYIGVITDANGQVTESNESNNTASIQITSSPVVAISSDGDCYITKAGTPLTVSAAAGVLANDLDPNGLPLSATLMQTTAHGTLALNPDGSFSYTPQAGFVGTDSFTYTAHDAVLSSTVTTASIVVGSLSALTSPEQLATELYVGYYNRAPDVGGLNYWLNNYNTPPSQSPGGINPFYHNLGQAAASFADPHQTETVTLYPFLANPQASTYSDVVSFLDSAYGNLFNRTPDTLGEEYWATSIAKSLGISVPVFGNPVIDNTGPVAASQALLALIAGAQNNDAQTVANKVTAGLYYYDQLAANNINATSVSAHAALSVVTSDPASVLTSEAATNAFVQSAPHAASAAVATVGILDSAQSLPLVA